MWITLALQKQKGFREQQQNRDERRSLREAKLVEKHARDRESVIILNPDSHSNAAFAGTPSCHRMTPSLPAGYTTEPNGQ